MTLDQAYEMCRELRNAGFAVVVFSPKELRGADPMRVSDAMMDRGNDAIDDLVGPEDGE